MGRFLAFLLSLCFLLRAESDSFLSGNEDPALFHHVNVITGHLNLSFQDITAAGAKPIQLRRTYSSSGALERSPDNMDLILKCLKKGWSIEGGWNILPHLYLLIEPAPKRGDYKAYLQEPSGSYLSYTFSHFDSEHRHIIYLKPEQKICQSSGFLTTRSNPQYNVLRIDLKEGAAMLQLPDGGSRHYKGEALHYYKGDVIGRRYCRLEKEIAPSGHEWHYLYSEERKLKAIESRNPGGQKLFCKSEFYFAGGEDNMPFELSVITSDKKRIAYKSTRHENRNYINHVITDNKPSETIHLTPGRKGIGARLSALELAGVMQFRVSYHMPASQEEARLWDKRPDLKEFHIDKVAAILAPHGPNDAEVALARFTYYPKLTEVRDAEGLLIRYHHDDEKITEIEYYDQNDQLHSSQRFYWKDQELVCKALLDGQKNPIFAKSFVYDRGNVTEEILWGSLTGEEISPLEIDELGNPSGGESYTKFYTYYTDDHNLLQSEREEEGPTLEYHYKPGTDLLTLKLTKDQKGQILIREFYQYNSDNLLISEILDDGLTIHAEDLQRVTYRSRKSYELSPQTHLPITIDELTLDLKTGKEHLLKRTRLTYDNQKVVKEAIYDATGHYRYTIETEYALYGHVKRRTTPLGQSQHTHYNKLGQLEFSKELGSSAVTYTYDKAGRQTSITEKDSHRTTHMAYDTKGRLIAQTDPRGHTTRHTYDYFGNRKSTELPAYIDSVGSHHPTFTFEVDLLGNLISAQMPLGETTETRYNFYRHPTHITHPDGSKTRHFYNRNGTLARTILSDGSVWHYTYDILKRLIDKRLISNNKNLMQERWYYTSLHMIAHADPCGLITEYRYDGAGRKIAERAEGRSVTYGYDSLGFLQRVDDGFVAHIQKNNVAGLIEEQWEEDSTGRIENRMKFFYDDENRKVKAIRLTSEGDAQDTFAYTDGKLTLHTDPLGATTRIHYDEYFINPYGQTSLQKTTVTALGDSTIETYDPAGRLIIVEKRDATNQTHFKESYLYDLSGHKTQRTTIIYVDQEPQRELCHYWKYDAMGRVIEESESDLKVTLYEYDQRGRLSSKILPSGTTLSYTYDGADRMLTLQSDDGTINYQYHYERGPSPTQIIDHTSGFSLTRRYNSFGQLLRETHSSGATLLWTYDPIGRPTSFTLPDGSCVQTHYSGAHMTRVQRHGPTGELAYEHRYLNFDPNGHVSKETLIGQLGVVQTTHDLLERPKSQLSPYLEQKVTYDRAGRLIKKSSSLFGKKSYGYDALNQLITEGRQNYSFDSLGNPADAQVNTLNQITHTKHLTIAYDPNGNPTQRQGPSQTEQYDYDALGRLTAITIPFSKKVHYTYDPLSRLQSKQTYLYRLHGWECVETRTYLYDQECEVGLLDEEGRMLQFKVLGLGLGGDTGAAVAIELDGTPYAPLHDFTGNIVALLDLDGELAESYDMDAFGRTSKAQGRNPWRFHSKRNEEGLIFFGLRFYDPTLGRWLTPDPAGFCDGANLYAYVRNNPLNRLDLFGLSSQETFRMPEIHIFVPLNNLLSPHAMDGILCGGTINGASVNFFVSHTQWNKLQFTPEELRSDTIDLTAHMHELIPSEGRCIAATSFGNGINTKLHEFENSNKALAEVINGPLMISLYNPTLGVGLDMYRAQVGIMNLYETPNVARARQFIIWLSTAVKEINEEAFTLLIPHSENGVITKRAIEGMNKEQQTQLQKSLLIFAVGPARPLKADQGCEVQNVYSEKDFVTGVGMINCNKYINNSDYNIKFLNSLPETKLQFGFIDHNFLGATYKNSWTRYINQKQKKIGFYGKETPSQYR